jgi:hypothetical protein
VAMQEPLDESGQIDLLALGRARRARANELAEQIAVCAARIDAATHQLLTLIRAFEREKVWARQAAKSTAAWLSWRLGLGLCAAREKVRVATALGELPKMDAALARAELSYAKVRAMTRVATPDNEELLLAQARGTTGAQLERICSGFRRALRGKATDDEHRFVRRRTMHDGSVQIEARLLPDEAELVWKAIGAARASLRGGDPLPISTDSATRADTVNTVNSVNTAVSRGGAQVHETSAGDFRSEATLVDGLVAISEAALAAEGKRAGRPGAERHTLFVHLSERDLQAAASESGDHNSAPDVTHVGEMAAEHGEVKDLRTTRHWKAELFDGVALSGESLLRLACDCGLVAAKVGATGDVLDLGRRRRTVSPALRRALLLRDRGCRFPGCHQRAFVDAHHIQHWAHGGETALDNTVLLCHRHHVALHEGGFRIERGDGTPASSGLRFFDAGGHFIDPAPRPPAGAGGIAALEAEQSARGLAIDWRTGQPRLPKGIELAGCVRALVRRHEGATAPFECGVRRSLTPATVGGAPRPCRDTPRRTPDGVGSLARD